MQYNGSAGQMHPPDNSMLLEQLFESQRDQTKELRQQSNALGWIMAQLSTGSGVHRELKAAVSELKETAHELKADVALLKAAASPEKQSPAKFNVIADSLAGLLHAGRPYLVCVVLVAGKLLGLGPSWIEPLIKKLGEALLQ